MPRERVLDQELVVRRFDIVGAHDRERLTETVERMISRFRIGRGVGAGEHGQTGDKSGRHARRSECKTRHRITFSITREPASNTLSWIAYLSRAD